MKPRRNASMENAKCYAPQILVGTEGLPREQWLEYRRKGIGGSDAAAVLGISPFRTGRDLYYDKLNIVTADDAENWVQLEVGTLLEPLVAKIFAHKTGYKIYRRPFMFQHPLYRGHIYHSENRSFLRANRKELQAAGHKLLCFQSLFGCLDGICSFPLIQGSS